LAAHYGFGYLDTGKLYRAVAYAVMQAGGDVTRATHGAKAARAIDAGDVADPALKSGPVGVAASKVAVHVEVRTALLKLQRDFADNNPLGGAVLDGRDIGTVICPDADVKLYVDALPEIRAKRRHAELVGYGEDISYGAVLAQLIARDTRDKNRAEAPLKPANDAHLIDTSTMGIDEVFEAAVQIVDAMLAAAQSKKE
jgi:cytidylate kinase